MMIDQIDAKTVAGFHAAGKLYGQQELEDACMQWLERRLTIEITSDLLRSLDVDLMTKIVSSYNVFILGDEAWLYIMMRQWLFVRLVPDWDASIPLPDATDNFIERMSKDWGKTEAGSFLLTDEGGQFIRAFGQVRLHHIVAEFSPISDCLKTDRIIPVEWLKAEHHKQWRSKVKLETPIFPGPLLTHGVDFESECIRGGCTVTSRMDIERVRMEVERGDFKFYLRSKYISLVSYEPDTAPPRHVIVGLTVDAFDASGRHIYTGVQQVPPIRRGQQKPVAKFQLPLAYETANFGFRLLSRTPPGDDDNV
jgi:hypothetical protein